MGRQRPVYTGGGEGGCSDRLRESPRGTFPQWPPWWPGQRASGELDHSVLLRGSGWTGNTQGPHREDGAGPPGKASKGWEPSRAASSHRHAEPSAVPRATRQPAAPGDPAHRAGPASASPSAAGCDRQPSAGLFLRQILIKRILLMMSGGDLAARAWRASRPTSRRRKDEDAKAPHCPPAVGKRSYANTSFEPTYKEVFATAF